MHTRLGRRGFLGWAITFPFLAAAGMEMIRGQRSASASSPTPKLNDPRLKIALNAYSFSRLLNENAKNPGSGVSLMQLLDFCAQHGFEGIDPTGYFFPGYPDVPADKYVDGLKRRAAELGLGISGTGVRNNFTTADKAVRAAGVQHIKQWVEVAARLGAPVLRVFADTQMKSQTWETVSQGSSRDQVEGWIADNLRDCAEHGKKFGVVIGVQNHGDFLKTSDQHLRLIKRVDSPWCGPIVDTGYYRSDDPYKDIAAVAPYAVNWQVKESPVGAGNEVRTDLIKLLTVIRLSGYRGYLPIETLSARGQDYDPFVVVPKFLAQLRKAVEATASIESPAGTENRPVLVGPTPTNPGTTSPAVAAPATEEPTNGPASTDPATPRRARKPPNKNKRNPPGTP